MSLKTQLARRQAAIRLIAQLPPQARADAQSDLRLRPWGYYDPALIASLQLTLAVANDTRLDGEPLYKAFDAAYTQAEMRAAIEAVA